MALHDEQQATQLDSYCATLRRDPHAPAPTDLDAELAGLARQLARQAAPEPSGATLVAIQRRVMGGTVAAGAAMSPNAALRRWPEPPSARSRTMAPARPPARPPLPARVQVGGVLAFLLLAAAFIGALALLLPGSRERPPTVPGMAVAANSPVASRPVFPAPLGVVECLPAAPTPTIRPGGAAYTATAGAVRAAQPTAQPSAVPTPPVGSVSLAEARTAVRAFIGEPDAVLTGEYDPGIPSLRRPQYLLKRHIVGSKTLDTFTVDAASGEVFGVSMPSNDTPCAPKQPIDGAEGLARAEAFARSHYPNFDRLASRSSQISTEAPFILASMSWQLRAVDSGAWLPTGVGVQVSLATGRIIQYSRFHHEYTGPTMPQLSMEQARELALAEARKDPRLVGATVEETILFVHAPGQAYIRAERESRLVWRIRLSNPPPGQDPRNVFFVDASTGEVLRGEAGG